MFYISTKYELNKPIQTGPYTWFYPSYVWDYATESKAIKDFDKLFDLVNKGTKSESLNMEQTIVDGKVTLRYFLVGLGKDDIENVSFSRKTRVLTVDFKNKKKIEDKIKKPIDIDSLIFKSFDKGILVFEGKVEAANDEKVKISID